VASRPINKGELFSQSNIIARRTGGQGLSAIRLYDLIGMKSNKDFGANEIISIDE
jgi:sialic acid synthase SpsE